MNSKIYRAQAQLAWEDAVTKLNPFNFDALLELCSRLSAFEFTEPFLADSKPFINMEVVRLFADAAIESRASNSRDRLMNGEEFRVFRNQAVDISDPRFREEIENGADRDLMLFQVRRFMSRVGGFQFPARFNFFEEIGRSIVFFQDIPADPSLTVGNSKAHFDKFRSTCREHLGASVLEFQKVLCLLAVLAHQVGKEAGEIYEDVKSLPLPLSTHGWAQRPKSANAIQRLVEAPSTFRGVSVSIDDLRANRELNPQSVDAVVQTLSRSPEDLRRQARAARQMGEPAWRFSALTRYPIVRTGERLVVPNIRNLLKGPFDLLHYSFLEKFGHEYQLFTGPATEAYVFFLLKRCLGSKYTIVRERSYTGSRHGRSRRDGPDFFIFDHEANRAILLECKARRLNLPARIELADESLRQYFGAMLDVFAKLPAKLQDISEVQEYSDAGDLLRRCSDGPIFVYVAVEPPIFASTLLHQFVDLRKRGLLSMEESELKIFDTAALESHPCCVLGLRTLEKALEACRQNGESLSGLVYDYYLDSLEWELDTSAPELLRDRGKALDSGIAMSAFEREFGSYIRNEDS